MIGLGVSKPESLLIMVNEMQKLANIWRQIYTGVLGIV